MNHLDHADLLVVARAALQAEPPVRDHGIIEAAAARPRMSAFGQDAYPDLWLKAAALLHALAKGHPLVDGNKRLSWLSTRVFLELNGVPGIPVPVDDAENLVVGVAAGRLDEVADIATALRTLYESAAG
jgi:death on curing protein